MRTLAQVLVLLLSLCAPGVAAAEERGYLGSAACTGCHLDGTEAWRGSHHALAWQPADKDSIVADFDGSEFALDGMTARFDIDADGTHQVTVQELDGTTITYPVHSVVGVEPLQQYLLETEPGRLQSFDVVWDTEEDRWFHLYPEADLSPGQGLHWTGPYKTWNARCAECHATGFEKNYNFQTRSYASTWVEKGVGCEACHGPGAGHVDWAEAADDAPPENYGFTVDFSDTEAGIQQCATCHARRGVHLDGNPLPGTPFHDSYSLALLRSGLYESDGQILDEVYVYGSFLQSKMYASGVGCLNCHDAHDAQPVAEGNAVCTQCHNPAGNPDFPTLKERDYDSAGHHFHAPDSAAGECKTCHMVERVYMGNDWRADHSFRVPRPDLSAETGAPDACTTCHEDRDPDWAADRIAQWYPGTDNRGPHYGSVLARGQAHPAENADDLTALALDTSQAGIVRATALWLLSNTENPMSRDAVAGLTADPDSVVRGAAAQSQLRTEGGERLERLRGLLRDPVRSVRIEAARALLNASDQATSAADQADLRLALADWRMSMSNRLDFPETHIQLAGMALTMREFPAAVSAFGEVVARDPQHLDAWVMLVRINAAMGAPDTDLRDLVSQALAANPGNLPLISFLQELGGAPPADGLLPPKRQD